MTAVTEDQLYDRVPKAIYHALLDVGNANTWVCPLGEPEFAQITIREDIDTHVNYTLSGQTFTFQESGGAGVKIAITVYGKL